MQNADFSIRYFAQKYCRVFVQFDGALAQVARRVLLFVYFAQFSSGNLVQHYHLTFSQNFGKIYMKKEREVIQMYKLYSRISDHDTILETWGASTHHPDAIFCFSDFNKSPYSDEFCQIFPWLLECASRMTWVSHAYSLGDFAFKCYDAIMEARKIELKIEKSA